MHQINKILWFSIKKLLILLMIRKNKRQLICFNNSIKLIMRNKGNIKWDVYFPILASPKHWRLIRWHHSSMWYKRKAKLQWKCLYSWGNMFCLNIRNWKFRISHTRVLVRQSCCHFRGYTSKRSVRMLMSKWVLVLFFF